MRISIRRGDRGYDPTHARKVKSVTVDGVLVTAVVADEEAGYAECLQFDPADPTRLLMVGGEPVLRRLDGRVRVELHEDGRAWDRARRGDARVRVGREPGSGDVLVQVYSVVRPGAIKQMRLERARLPLTEAALCQKVGLAAGAAAEMLAAQFGDTVDPSEAARAATEQALRMVRDEVGASDPYRGA